jgi:peptidoglycan/LPS O-acetylase OafA/YrhL
MTATSSRMPLPDALKALASQLIVLHHFSAYGPLSDALAQALPALAGWLYEYARMAVQVFLVVGGFLAARSLAPHGQAGFERPLALVWSRYQRLVLPFGAALLLAIGCALLVRSSMDDDIVPERAGVLQLLGHLLLLHDVLDMEALTAGAWYVAIDFQLFVLLVGLLWLARAIGRGRAAAWGVVLVAGLGAASLFHFNRDAGWDDWGLYFFGAYALGALAWWAADRHRSPAWLAAIAVASAAALVLDFRLRIAIALAVALTLGLAHRRGVPERWPQSRPIAFLGRISYAVFLVHFPVYLLVSGLYAASGADSAAAAAVALAVGWLACIAAGQAFHRLVEAPAARLVQRRTG